MKASVYYNGKKAYYGGIIEEARAFNPHLNCHFLLHNYRRTQCFALDILSVVGIGR
jgi:hypothetical protein